MVDDDRLQEHLERFQQPDSYCLHCGRPAGRHYPVGPITITVSEPDSCALHARILRMEMICALGR